MSPALDPPVRPSLGSALTMVVLSGAIGALVALQVGLLGGGRPAYRPWPVPPPALARFDIGVTTLPLARNSWRAWQPADLATVNAFEHSIRAHVNIVMWYADWAHAQPLLGQLEAVARRGSIPEITWEPWDSTHPVRVQPQYRLRTIIAGRYDPYIRAWARTLAGYRMPVRLRFAHEMNGNWYPWSEAANGNRPHEYVLAWRHIHKIFAAAGANNVKWVWSPAAINIPAAQYPGNAYVDVVSLSVFNGGLQLRYNPWRPFAAAVRRPLARLRTLAPGKPIEFSEVGCSEDGGDKSAWISGMFAALRRYPPNTSLIWYELPKGSDWRVETSHEAAAAFASAVGGTPHR